jgi:rubrerythrin
VRRIVSQVACNIVAKYHSANTYKQLETIKGEIEKKALSEIDDTLSEYGLRTIGGLVLNIVLLEETRQMIKDADDEDKKKEQAKQKRMDEENAAYRDSALIRELMNKSGANSTNADNTVSGLVCPHCNAKLDKKVAFCPVCGQKL